MSEPFQLEVNGKTIAFTKGQTILEVCRGLCLLRAHRQ